MKRRDFNKLMLATPLIGLPIEKEPIKEEPIDYAFCLFPVKIYDCFSELNAGCGLHEMGTYKINEDGTEEYTRCGISYNYIAHYGNGNPKSYKILVWEKGDKERKTVKEIWDFHCCFGCTRKTGVRAIYTDGSRRIIEGDGSPLLSMYCRKYASYQELVWRKNMPCDGTKLIRSKGQTLRVPEDWFKEK